MATILWFETFCNLYAILLFRRQIRLEKKLKSLLWKIDFSEISFGRSDLDYFGTPMDDDPPVSASFISMFKSELDKSADLCPSTVTNGFIFRSTFARETNKGPPILTNQKKPCHA